MSGLNQDIAPMVADELKRYMPDLVEVVRCKDCRWWERDYQPRYHPDERPCNIVGMGTSPEWFCADGEVRR